MRLTKGGKIEPSLRVIVNRSEEEVKGVRVRRYMYRAKNVQ
jgi:hypothetical protein